MENDNATKLTFRFHKHMSPDTFIYHTPLLETDDALPVRSGTSG